MTRASAAPPAPAPTFGYAFDRDAESWIGGQFPSRAVAIAAAHAEVPEARTIYTARARDFGIEDVLAALPPVDRQIEEINDRLSDDAHAPWGFTDDLHLQVTRDQLATLEAVLRVAWQLWLTLHPWVLADIWIAEEIERHDVDGADAA